MNHSMLALACAGLAAISITGCKPQAPVEPLAPVAPAAPAAPLAPVAAAGTANALDQKGFAGTFASGGSSITLNPDGTFSLKDGTAAFDGSWTAETEGARIRLDPNSKAEPDRLFAVVGQDEIRPLDVEGNAVDGSVGLQRESSGY